MDKSTAYNTRVKRVFNPSFNSGTIFLCVETEHVIRRETFVHLCEWVKRQDFYIF